MSLLELSARAAAKMSCVNLLSSFFFPLLQYIMLFWSSEQLFVFFQTTEWTPHLVFCQITSDYLRLLFVQRLWDGAHNEDLERFQRAEFHTWFYEVVCLALEKAKAWSNPKYLNLMNRMERLGVFDKLHFDVNVFSIPFKKNEQNPMFRVVLYATTVDGNTSKNLLLLYSVQKCLLMHSYKKTHKVQFFWAREKPLVQFNISTVLSSESNDFKTCAYLSRRMHSSFEIFLALSIEANNFLTLERYQSSLALTIQALSTSVVEQNDKDLRYVINNIKRDLLATLLKSVVHFTSDTHFINNLFGELLNNSDKDNVFNVIHSLQHIYYEQGMLNEEKKLYDSFVLKHLSPISIEYVKAVLLHLKIATNHLDILILHATASYQYFFKINRRNSLFRQTFMISLLINISQGLVEIKKVLMIVKAWEEEYEYKHQVDILYKFYKLKYILLNHFMDNIVSYLFPTRPHYLALNKVIFKLRRFKNGCEELKRQVKQNYFEGSEELELMLNFTNRNFEWSEYDFLEFNVLLENRLRLSKSKIISHQHMLFGLYCWQQHLHLTTMADLHFCPFSKIHHDLSHLPEGNNNILFYLSYVCSLLTGNSNLRQDLKNLKKQIKTMTHKKSDLEQQFKTFWTSSDKVNHTKEIILDLDYISTNAILMNAVASAL